MQIAASAAAFAFLASLSFNLGAEEKSAVEDRSACATPLASVVVIDDQVNTPPWAVDQMRGFRLPAPAQSLRDAIQSSRCFAVLDADPIFWSIPGVEQPELILRASVGEISAVQKSLGEKASTAVERYVGSYLGMTEGEVPALKSATVAVDVLCPRARRSVTRVARKTGEEATRPDQNGETIQRAFDEVVAELVETLRREPRLCPRLQ